MVPDPVGSNAGDDPRPAPTYRHSMSSSVSSRAAMLTSKMDSADAIALGPTFAEVDSMPDPLRDGLLRKWANASTTYRAMLAVYESEPPTSEGEKAERLATIDSLAGIVAGMKAALQAAERVEELRRIDAKLNPAGSFRFQGAQYSAVRVDPAALDIHLHWKDASGAPYRSIDRLKSDLEKNGKSVVMITNAGMYNPDNSPEGLYIEKGKQLVPLDTTAGPSGKLLNFYMKPNGVFYIGNDGPKVVTTEQFPKSIKGIRLATQSGPMLVIDGNLHPKFNKGSVNTNIRSGVGITEDKQVIFAISDKPVNFYDFAVLFRDALHCKHALYLDGAISQMYLPTSKRMDTGGDFGAILAVTR